MTFHVFGTNTIYSILQEFYTSPETNIRGAEGQDALVSLVGTIGSGLTWAGGIFVNPMIGHLGNIKLISLAGAFFMGLGLILGSFCNELWQLYLTQGLLYGIGTSMYYFPVMSVTPAYFNRNRGAAMGIVLSGSGVGGLVMSPVFNILLSRLGIRWVLRVLGVWNFVLGIPVSVVLTRKHAAAAGATGQSRISMALVKRGTFVLQCIGAFLQAAGYNIPIYYLTTYSVSILSYTSGTSSTLLAICNGVNSLSRVGMGILADRVGRQNTMVLSIILTAVSVFALWYDSDRSRFTAFVVLYGILSGGYNALLPSTISELYGVQNYSSVNGVLQLVRGLGVMFGAPIAGVILGSHSRGGTPTPSRLSKLLSINGLKTRYNDVVIFDGVLLLASGVCVAYVRWLDARDKGRWLWRA
ncbi:monocarboxylate transporter [Dichomitus squalens]|uniref:Monocarboxylate transporter n=1 Tax=Dichomitus squalens TaxID=114155 RepID=A0A4V2K995_9APHY|nr:monocarboxylate transporter [Dichomitus squalens LYAD-421 SS1]EJF64705.1 monocarboxylate transporter [Dichomitus squalens LYAD-421 SS1]TBU33596.1 monocarboxylate transporter [Dichomitus squalens]TBU46833.1 monocarboxylate transporter [Dichomitus squalens]TBU63008.1 monocarboxylate transporter [Dichomitus squalens]